MLHALLSRLLVGTAPRNLNKLKRMLGHLCRVSLGRAPQGFDQ
jgi:hypothetical protein